MVVATTPAAKPLSNFLHSPTSAAPPQAPPVRAIRWVPLVVAAVLAIGLSSYVWARFGAKPGALLLTGFGLGFTLFHSRFGFTSAWRQLIAVGNGTGLRAHAVLLGTAATVIAVIAAAGLGVFGAPQAVSPSPVGVALIVGSAMFGVGMQLGGACASGTLFAVGSGQSSIVFTLGGFVIGSTFYTWQYGWFSGWPTTPGLVLSAHVGWAGSWLITIAVLLLVVLVSTVVQRRRTPPPVSAPPSARGFARLWRGSWPLVVGGLVLGVLAGLVFLLSGGIWGVTSAFGLWGARFLQLIGLHPEHWAYYRAPAQAKSIAASVWTDKTTLTDVGIMIGAAIASAFGGAWVFHRRVPWRTALAAVLGGILMGIGARLANGCNIGAYLGGISTGNVSGWVWGLGALAGTWVGLKARPLFGLGVPKPSDSIC
jgi:uncharacterized membrane protein YedE/YeeE